MLQLVPMMGADAAGKCGAGCVVVTLVVVLDNGADGVV